MIRIISLKKTKSKLMKLGQTSISSLLSQIFSAKIFEDEKKFILVFTITISTCIYEDFNLFTYDSLKMCSSWNLVDRTFLVKCWLYPHWKYFFNLRYMCMHWRMFNVWVHVCHCRSIPPWCSFYFLSMCMRNPFFYQHCKLYLMILHRYV